MKKLFKILTALLIVAFSLLVFSGCENPMVKDLKSTIDQVVWDANLDFSVTIDGASVANGSTIGEPEYFEMFTNIGQTYVLNIKNRGERDVTISNLEITGDSEYSIAVNPAPVGGGSLVIPPGVNQSINISFVLPESRIGDYTGSISFDSSDEEQPNYNVNIANVYKLRRKTVKIAAGIYHTAALLDDSTVMTWGYDDFGMLGNDTELVDQSLPVAVSGLTGVVAIATGGYHTVALLDDGTMMTWGADFCGELGNDALFVDQSLPVAVSGLTGVVAIAAGELHTVALLDDGTIMIWGEDYYGQLGYDAAAVDQPLPVAVSGLTGVAAIAAGYRHTMALLDNGTVMTWGRDNFGQLGDDTAKVDQSLPVAVSGLTGVVAIAAGELHTVALLDDGTIMTWGSDSDGQLGNDALFVDQSLPVAVSGLTGVVAIAAGGYHTVALLDDGTVITWGGDDFGQLGNDALFQYKSLPVTVSGLSGVVAIAAGYRHTMALLDEGIIMTWGRDYFGQLGDDIAKVDQPLPVAVSDLTSVTAIATGGQHTVALLNDSTMMTWGYDGNGQLGDDTSKINQPTSVAVSGLTGVAAIAAGGGHTAALLGDGTVRTWGSDSVGQLGDDTAKVGQPLPVAVSGLSGVAAIAAEGSHTVALLDDGTVMTWGSDSDGQLGNDALFVDQSLPVAVSSLTGVVAIAAGYYHTVALLDDGTVMTWGSDGNGQLGDDTAKVDQPLPMAVSGLTGVAAIAAGYLHTVALLDDGTVMTWGSDSDGQLGNDTAKVDQPLPVAVSGLTGVAAIAAGRYHTGALLDDGTVMTWGSDGDGQLGDDTAKVDQPLPVAVSGLTGVAAIAAGGYHTVALLDDSTVMTWGRDFCGQLGDDTAKVDQPLPVVVINPLYLF